ncbi:MAG: hypothetical protein IAC42_02620 [Spirochaetes bacterium]|uniref:Uncharacterized protein n=1 Tax=Candidatus Aphodenecus pullistercoris TaxID=2840669 RepID=A0A9D9E7I5_9SPIR|nr:hypothetical protein [Candidatus Aphodenecus pullistercoris]
MKKLSIVALMLLLSLSLVFANGSAESTQSSDGELNGTITFWHSFTQGKRMEATGGTSVALTCMPRISYAMTAGIRLFQMSSRLKWYENNPL